MGKVRKRIVEIHFSGLEKILGLGFDHLTFRITVKSQRDVDFLKRIYDEIFRYASFKAAEEKREVKA